MLVVFLGLTYWLYKYCAGRLWDTVNIFCPNKNIKIAENREMSRQRFFMIRYINSV